MGIDNGGSPKCPAQARFVTNKPTANGASNAIPPEDGVAEGPASQPADTQPED